MSSRTSLDEVTRRHNLRSTLAPHLERRESSLTSTTLPKSSLSPSLDDSDVEVASPTETRPHSKQMTQGESASQRPNRQRPKKERHYLISASAALHYIDQHYAGKNLNVPVSQVAGEIAQDCTMKYYDMSKKRFSTRKGRQVYDLLYQIAEQSDVTTKGLVESGTQLASDDLLGKIKEELAMSEMSDEEHTGEDSNASSDASSNAARLTKSRPDSRRQPLSLNHSTKVSTPPAVPSTSSRANANGYSLRKRSGTPTSFVSSGNKHKRCRNGKQRSSDERPAQVFNTQEERTQASQDVNSVEQVSVNGSSTQPSPVQPSIGAPPTTRATYTLGRNESDSVVEANQNVDPAFINILSRLTRARDLQLINLDKLRYDQVLDGLALLAKQNVGSNAGGTSSPQASLSSATIDLDATTHDMPTGPPLSHVSTTDFDFFGTYGEHVAGRLSNIYSAVVSITYEQLLAMKVNLKQRARFVFVPEPRLGALYKQIAGQGIARRRVALIEENITCSGLITSLIGAFLHSQVFLGAAVPTADAFIEAGNRWLGPFRRSYERQLAESGKTSR